MGSRGYFNNEKQSYIHGDCKVTNLLFDDSSDVAKSIIDLDTVHLRSWTLDFAVLSDQFLQVTAGLIDPSMPQH